MLMVSQDRKNKIDTRIVSKRQFPFHPEIGVTLIGVIESTEVELGTYLTENRAEEILDELHFYAKRKYPGEIYYMPQDSEVAE